VPETIKIELDISDKPDVLALCGLPIDVNAFVILSEGLIKRHGRGVRVRQVGKNIEFFKPKP